MRVSPALLVLALVAAAAFAYIEPPVEPKAPPGSGGAVGGAGGEVPKSFLDWPEGGEGQDEPGDGGPGGDEFEVRVEVRMGRLEWLKEKLLDLVGKGNYPDTVNIGVTLPGGEVKSYAGMGYDSAFRVGAGSHEVEIMMAGVKTEVWGIDPAVTRLIEFWADRELVSLTVGDEPGGNDFEDDDGTVYASLSNSGVSGCTLGWMVGPPKPVPAAGLEIHEYADGLYRVIYACRGGAGQVVRAKKEIKVARCGEPDVWCKQAGACMPPLDCANFGVESMCEHGWPAGEGVELYLNSPGYSCDIFEVASPAVGAIAEEAAYCCANGCDPTHCHGSCLMGYKPPSIYGESFELDKFKKCTAFYVAYGVGKEGVYMRDYFYPELCCFGTAKCEEKFGESYLGKCEPREDFNENVKGLPCDTDLWEWRSDTNMGENTCNFITPPAHASLGILETGTCQDYSVALTTLLRRLGYGKDEAYTLSGVDRSDPEKALHHSYNILRLPKSEKWNVVETTNNFKHPLNSDGLPVRSDFPYCNYVEDSCVNDFGDAQCPDKKQVWGCDE